MKQTIIVILIAAVLLVAVVQAFQIGSLENKITAKATGSSGTIDMTGWTENDKMNYEMHGVIPASAGSGSASGGSGMVGGC